MTALTSQDVADLERIEAEIEDDLPEFKKRGLRLGSNLRTVRDRELYKKDYKTFEAYLELRWDISRSRAYQLIDWDKVVKSLPKKLSAAIDTERKARALVAAPPDQQAKAVDNATSSGEPITSKSLSNTLVINKNLSTTGGQNVSDTVIVRDFTGYIIPEERLPLWDRRDEPKSLLQKLSDVRSFFRNLMEEGGEGRSDILYRECNTHAILSELDMAYADMKRAVPWAVCPLCQGGNSDACMTCKGRGLISQHMWDQGIRSDLKAIRAKSCTPVELVEEEE